jgi:hypothetical protein
MPIFGAACVDPANRLVLYVGIVVEKIIGEIGLPAPVLFSLGNISE